MIIICSNSNQKPWTIKYFWISALEPSFALLSADVLPNKEPSPVLPGLSNLKLTETFKIS